MSDSTPATAASGQHQPPWHPPVRPTPPPVAAHDHPDCHHCQQERYERAKADPVASIVLEALHTQDAATYNGASGDMGKRALEAAGRIRSVLDDE